MASKPHHYHVYSDESCINQAEFMVIGATVGKPCALDRMARRIDSLEPKPGVMKWDKLKAHKLDTYLAALDVFFDFNARREVDFHAMIIRNSGIRHRKYSSGDSEVGFQKFIYQLYASLHTPRRYGMMASYRCFPDFRKTNYDLQELRRALNATFPIRAGGVSRPSNVFREIQWGHEHDHRAAQINDLLTGATGFLVNSRRSTGKDDSKERLARQVLHECPHCSFAENSPVSEWHFRLWHFALGD